MSGRVVRCRSTGPITGASRPSRWTSFTVEVIDADTIALDDPSEGKMVYRRNDR